MRSDNLGVTVDRCLVKTYSMPKLSDQMATTPRRFRYTWSRQYATSYLLPSCHLDEKYIFCKLRHDDSTLNLLKKFLMNQFKEHRMATGTYIDGTPAFCGALLYIFVSFYGPHL